MTALAGFWSFGAAEAAPACARMLKAQSVYAADPAAQRDVGAISLGRRLARLLPEDVHDRAPVIGAGGRLVLVADVRLDDRTGLAAELCILPAEARGLSDSAILMRALERWGDDAVERLVGDFAFALWDGQRHRLLLARDFLGQRPLHYHRGAGFFAFASMPKGLHALPEVPYELDEPAVTDFLALMPETGSASFFNGIDKVPPGHMVSVTRDRVETRRWWDPSPRPLRLKNQEEYAEALRESLDRAVAARLRGADGHVGAQLSGGLDSAAVTATAARLLAGEGGRVTAFTSVPRHGYDGGGLRGAIVDEGPLAAATASLHPNIDHVLIRTGGRSPFERLDRIFFLYERPFINLCNAVWTDAINEAARERGLRILLTGQMGNMSFSWTGLTLLPRLLRQGRLLRFLAASGALLRNGTRFGTIASQSLGPFLPEAAWKAVTRLRGKGSGLGDYSLVHPQAARRLAISERAAARGHDPSYRPRADGIATRLWALSRVDLGNFTKGTLGGWGIDLRDPTADRRLIELCLTIPDELFLRGGVPRGLARSAFADRLPAAVTVELRKGYQGADWHEGLAADRDSLAQEVERIAAAPAAAAAIDSSRMRRLVEEWPEEGSWNDIGTIQRYRAALLRGVSAGHFARKASRRND